MPEEFNAKKAKMIVCSMTEAELGNEILKDMLNVMRYSDHFDPKFRRLVLKARTFPVRTCIEYNSPRKNKWLILYKADTKKNVGDYAIMTCIVMYDSPFGIHAIMRTSTNGIHNLAVYPPHFFKRFNERGKIGLHGVDLIKRYFIYNSTYVYAFNNGEVYGSSQDGVAMGILSEHGNTLFKTFITYDMTKGSQVEEFAKNEKIRQEIHENLYNI